MVAALALVLMVVLSLLLRREVGLPARVASHYVELMAGSLTADIPEPDPDALARTLQGAGLAFSPRIGSLDPEFRLIGGRIHSLAERPTAVWLYQDRRFEMLLGEAFAGTLADLGRPDEVRDEPPLRLHVFRKTTQTLVFWQEGPLVYVLTATLPGEQTIALARRLARDEAVGGSR